MSRSLVVKLTAGVDEPERCSQAFTVAASAAASGVPVSLWLTGDAVRLGLPGRAEAFELPHSSPLKDSRDLILDAGTITVCSPCAARREISEADLIPGVRFAGAATFVDEIMQPEAQALVY